MHTSVSHIKLLFFYFSSIMCACSCVTLVLPDVHEIVVAEGNQYMWSVRASASTCTSLVHLSLYICVLVSATLSASKRSLSCDAATPTHQNKD